MLQIYFSYSLLLLRQSGTNRRMRMLNPGGGKWTLYRINPSEWANLKHVQVEDIWLHPGKCGGTGKPSRPIESSLSI